MDTVRRYFAKARESTKYSRPRLDSLAKAVGCLLLSIPHARFIGHESLTEFAEYDSFAKCSLPRLSDLVSTLGTRFRLSIPPISHNRKTAKLFQSWAVRLVEVVSVTSY